MTTERFSDSITPGDHLQDGNGNAYLVKETRPEKVANGWEFLCHRASDDREMWISAETLDKLHAEGTLTRTYEANPVHCQPA